MKNTHYYRDQWESWPFPVIKIPSKLNPFENDGVELFAATASHLPYENIKFYGVLGLLNGAEKCGALDGTHTLVEATSGNTGIVLAGMAKAFGISHVKLVVAPDLPDGKRYPLILAGADIIAPHENMSAIATARALGGGGWKPDNWQHDNGVLNLDQYANPNGITLYTDFVAPKILGQMDHAPTVFVAGIGTGGTLIGVGNGLRQRIKSMAITTVGVLLSPGHEIPGVRDKNRMKEITLPWETSADHIVEMETRSSYLASLWFNWIMGITPGPSSGFAYLGALQFLKNQKKSDTLDSVRAKDGKIRVVILFPDGHRPYGDRFMANLPFEWTRPSTAPLPWALL
ncbi:MAG: pyridoxal-phosphate dependent enzyme [Candidatus Paceibacterota bacterium]|jgi:cysteine synthase